MGIQRLQRQLCQEKKGKLIGKVVVSHRTAQTVIQDLFIPWQQKQTGITANVVPQWDSNQNSQHRYNDECNGNQVAGDKIDNALF